MPIHIESSSSLETLKGHFEVQYIEGSQCIAPGVLVPQELARFASEHSLRDLESLLVCLAHSPWRLAEALSWDVSTVEKALRSLVQDLCGILPERFLQDHQSVPLCSEETQEEDPSSLSIEHVAVPGID